MNKMILALIILITIFLQCQTWIDDHTEFMECTFDEIEQVRCNGDLGFDICWISLKWEKLIDCDEIDGFITGEYFVWGEYIDGYSIQYHEYFECCHE